MKQMLNVSSGEYGVVEDSMIMDDEPVLGRWQLTATSHIHYNGHNQYSKKVILNQTQNIIGMVYLICHKI